MSLEPTIDTNYELAQPTWREDHNIPVLQSRTLMKQQPSKPMTHRVNNGLRSRQPNSISVRHANGNPANAGTGHTNGIWGLSSPTMPGMGEETAAPVNNLLVVAGAATVGYLLFKILG